MICFVLALNLDLKMSSKLTSICDSDHSDSLPSVLYGADVFDNLREISEEIIEPPCINCWKKGVPCVEFATARSPRCQFCNLGKRNCSQANHNFPENPRRLWSSIKKGGRFGVEPPVDEPLTSDATSVHSNLTGSRTRGVQQWTDTRSSWANTGGPIHPQGDPIGVVPEVPILVTRKDGRLEKLKGNLVVQDENDTDAEGIKASTTTNEVIRPLQQPQPPIRPPTRPSILASTSTNIQPPVASTSRDPMSPEPESIFDNRCVWNITGKLTDQKKVNKKVVTSLFAEVDALTEVFVDNAMKSAIPGEPTIALAQEEAAYEDDLVVKLREALKKV
ncbi:hypothetical protein O181_110968 [Austropuccinia psidii MF-1]|uniref:Uncharacterized protein n=1 Tax=Austropuccinia psidii MF-1 TaxID=1389203 RepID=A0A9Q3JXP2_9BASI|nr:hypothetical protein [Austropuccinia psidii MF-1]